MYCAVFSLSVTSLYSLCLRLDLSVIFLSLFCSLSRPLWASLCPLCGFSVTILHPLWTSAAILWRFCTALSHSEPLRGRMLYKRSSRIARGRHGTGESDEVEDAAKSLWKRRRCAFSLCFDYAINAVFYYVLRVCSFGIRRSSTFELVLAAPATSYRWSNLHR
jgi:hypothetical protein